MCFMTDGTVAMLLQRRSTGDMYPKGLWDCARRHAAWLSNVFCAVSRLRRDLMRNTHLENLVFFDKRGVKRVHVCVCVCLTDVVGR